VRWLLKENQEVFLSRDKLLKSKSLETSNKINSGLLRIQSIDILRGAVMIIMAIDHVRVYTGIPAGGTTAGVFFGRWITHYCAPSFAFFAGTSAFLYFQKSGNRKDLVKFLLTRGILLVVFELTVIRFFWTFNFEYANYLLAGVIWMLGWCMILFTPFVKLRPVTIGVIGLIMISVQQVFHYVPDIFPSSVQEPVREFWGFFYPSASKNTVLTGKSGLENIYGVSILYVLLPWIGVMMAGYGFGQLLLRDPAYVKRICLRIGISALFLFIIGGSIVILINPSANGNLPFLFKLLGQQKYPPSQLYLLMTLGPMIALVPWTEKAKGWLADALKIVGRVPMFYYILHLLLIHLSAFVVNLLLTGSIHQEWYNTAPLVGIPEDQRWGLPLLYLVWLTDVVILYFICRWYAHYKSSHPERSWLKYL
jgi:uncharacterized membrane protein